ncbi:unnamed protein product [Paramecium sonneborni]|uniref:Uncharacterized protein n=1 Tax=Paramecium sonneborni TaxID=65129 RepID=A0A8S1RU62_9CILI|nr:unnamed protein product [Paramecium sonneborni]
MELSQHLVVGITQFVYGMLRQDNKKPIWMIILILSQKDFTHQMELLQHLVVIIRLLVNRLLINWILILSIQYTSRQMELQNFLKHKNGMISVHRGILQATLKQIKFIYYFQAVSIQEANQLVGSIESLHSALLMKNYYMPDLASSVITCEYLLNVALGKCFRIETNQIKIGQIFKKVSKIKLFYELEKLCQEKNVLLGISPEKLPDKKWLTNVLFTLNENNEVFKPFQDSDKVIRQAEILYSKQIQNCFSFQIAFVMIFYKYH